MNTVCLCGPWGYTTDMKHDNPSKQPIFVHIVSRLRSWVYRFNYVGLLCATGAFCVSMLPSLLPRPWLLQGILSGVSVAVGYGFGVGMSALGRWLTEYQPPIHVRRGAWRVLSILAPLALFASLILGARWQNEVRQLLGEPTINSAYMLRIIALTVGISVGIVLLSRGVRRLARGVIQLLDRALPRRLSVAVGSLLVVAFFVWVVSGVFADFLITQANTLYRHKNTTTPAGISQPTSTHRSGGPGSLIPWDTLGYQGRAFVAQGPNQTQLAEYTKAQPTEQIRIYAGLDSASGPAERAKLAVADLKRAGGFERTVLVLATATGTGWLEPQSVDSIEYMYGGDTAIVAQQYSYLPSWISFLVDQENATDAGEALYEAVYAEWSQLPKDTRPKLIAYGLSLGSFGGQTPYAGVGDMRLSLDGALFMGTPNDTRLWRTVTDSRDTGSPEWQPIYQNGTGVRFANTNADIARDHNTWQYPRILYMQHASDPVVWFNFDLLFHKPDWLREPRGPDVSSAVTWYPVITFLQVTVDQFFGTSVPNGHGHNYGNTVTSAWASITNPPNWSTEKATTLQSIIDSY